MSEPCEWPCNHDDYTDWLNDLMVNAGDEWDGDEAMESLVTKYVHGIEAKLAAAEAERDDGWAHQRAGAEALKILSAKLAKATAVVEAAESLVHWTLRQPNTSQQQIRAWSEEVRAAIANYHAGPAETETPGGGA